MIKILKNPTNDVKYDDLNRIKTNHGCRIRIKFVYYNEKDKSINHVDEMRSKNLKSINHVKSLIIQMNQIS